MSVLPYPPLRTEAKFVVLSDWDGTITDRDSNDYMTDNMGMGYEARRALNFKILDGSRTYRDAFHEMLDSVDRPFDECKKILSEKIGLDPGFKVFYDWCQANGIPVIIVSSGMEPTIRAVLSSLLPAEDANSIDIIANGVKYLDEAQKGDKWEIVYRHPESGYGHDKSKAILPYRDLPSKPTLFFCGDGVSDMSAAKHADLLFAKEMVNGDSDLMSYCKTEKIPFVPFTDFFKVLDKVKEVVAGKDVKTVLKEEGN